MAGTVIKVGDDTYCSCDPEGGYFGFYGTGPMNGPLEKVDPDYPGNPRNIIVGGLRRATNSVLEIPDGITTVMSLSVMIDITYTSAISTIIIGKDVEEVGGFGCTVDMRSERSVAMCRERDHLTSVIFRGKKVDFLSDRAFRARLNLQSVFIGYTPEVMGTELFADCESLVSVDFDRNLPVGRGMFAGCKSLERFNADNSVSRIPDGINARGAFTDCRSLTRLKFAETCDFPEQFLGQKAAFCQVERGKGIDCDENGYLKTYIEGSKSAQAMCHDFKGTEGRILLDNNDREMVRPYLAVNAYDGYEGYQQGDMWAIPLYPPDYFSESAEPQKRESIALNKLRIKDCYGVIWCILLLNPDYKALYTDFIGTGLLVNYNWYENSGKAPLIQTVAEIAVYADKYKYFDKSY